VGRAIDGAGGSCECCFGGIEGPLGCRDWACSACLSGSEGGVGGALLVRDVAFVGRCRRGRSARLETARSL